MYLTYAGLANKKIVEVMQKAGLNAVGLSGIDGKLIIGKKHPALLAVVDGKKKVIKDDLTGSVEGINTDFLKHLLSKDMVPVITPPIITTDGEVINADGDKVAAKVAADLKAKLLIFLIEAPGLLTDFQDKNSAISEVNKSNLEKLLPLISGRMKRKLLECIKLLDSGIEKIIIADGTIKLPITNALKGGGTHVCKS
jgi:acetylglutamate/LysW-gamma-L-alpha-aminoadipate kinase